MTPRSRPCQSVLTTVWGIQRKRLERLFLTKYLGQEHSVRVYTCPAKYGCSTRVGRPISGGRARIEEEIGRFLRCVSVRPRPLRGIFSPWDHGRVSEGITPVQESTILAEGPLGDHQHALRLLMGFRKENRISLRSWDAAKNDDCCRACTD